MREILFFPFLPGVVWESMSTNFYLEKLVG